MTTFRPREYQQAGIKWLTEKKAAALFWGMGAGKTPTTLTALDALIALGEVKKVLVIAPLRVASLTWSTEASKWDNLKDLRVARIIGDQKKRIAALKAEADIYVMGRDSVCWLCDYLDKNKIKWPFDTVVIDELSSFKSIQAKRWRALRRKRGYINRIIGLTGTPAANGYIDLWPQIYLLDTGERLGKTIGYYRVKYFRPDRYNGDIVYSYAMLPEAKEQIEDKLKDLCMSLDTKALKDDLPELQYINIELELDDKLYKQYKQFERDEVMEFLESGNTAVAANSATLSNKLLQFCNGAIYTEDENERQQVDIIHDVKLDALEELIEASGADNVLVLYAYKHDRDRIKERFKEARDIKSDSDVIDWNNGNIHVALAHPASIGYGLNMQYGGHIIIWYGLTWNLETYQQANKRLHRTGQASTCLIYHLIIKGTYDERVMQRLSGKAVTQQQLLDALIQEVKSEEIKK